MLRLPRPRRRIRMTRPIVVNRSCAWWMRKAASPSRMRFSLSPSRTGIEPMDLVVTAAMPWAKSSLIIRPVDSLWFSGNWRRRVAFPWSKNSPTRKGSCPRSFSWLALRRPPERLLFRRRHNPHDPELRRLLLRRPRSSRREQSIRAGCNPTRRRGLAPHSRWRRYPLGSCGCSVRPRDWCGAFARCRQSRRLAGSSSRRQAFSFHWSQSPR